jgi:hypothetical protein
MEDTDYIEDLPRRVRSTRNTLLEETDWLAMSDVTMSPEILSYRQSLRDITRQVGFPQNVIWPIKP